MIDIQRINELAIQAGDAILDIYRQQGSIAFSEKSDQSPVTQADIVAHEVISKGLTRLYPDIAVISEEAVLPTWEQRRQLSEYWLIDPLDGTKEFIKRSGQFTVNIALIRDHSPYLGVVYAPALQALYFAQRQAGAFKVNQHGTRTQLAVNSQNIDLACLRVAGSRSHGTKAYQQFVQQLGNVQSIAVGSSLKFCLVAEGDIDIYPRFGPTSEWDTAAAQAVLCEAGGYVLDIKTKVPLRYNTKDSILNSSFVACALKSDRWLDLLSSVSAPG